MITITNNTNNSASPEYNYDTINFTNGAMLFFYDQTTVILEPVRLVHGIAVTNGTDIIGKGFKFLPTFPWKKSSIDSTVNLYSSNDTSWNLSVQFPDSLAPLDSLYESHNMSEKGKWLYFTDPEKSFDFTTPKPIENFKTIMYVATKKGKMKIQVSSQIINIPFGGSSRVDTIKILWATDSCGNGKFLPGTTIDKNNKSPSKGLRPSPAFHPSFGVRSLADLKRGEAISVFDMRGRRSPSIAYRLPAGVFLLKIGTGKTAATPVVRWR